MAAPVSKKRKTRQDEDLSFVELPRDQLLIMSSMQLEDNIRSLTAIRSLTGPEEREIKRQRRLVKNREYAQTSRVKKKQFVEELCQENDVLRDRLRMLEEENHFLRFGGSAPHQPHYIVQPVHVVVNSMSQNQNFISNYPPPHQESCQPQDMYQNQQQTTYSSTSSMSQPHYSPSTNSEASVPGTPQSHPSANSVDNSSEFEYDSDDFFLAPLEEQPVPRMHQNPQFGSYADSLCLLVVLFSFAIFLTPFGNPFVTFPSNSGPRLVEHNIETFGTGRVLLSNEDLLTSPQAHMQPNDTNSPRCASISMSSVLAEESVYALFEHAHSGFSNDFGVPTSA